MEYTITRTIELTKHDGQQIKSFVEVEYKVGPDGPFTDLFTKDEFFTPSVVEMRLNDRARVIRSIRG